ncbi:hypothetical protein EDD18DRAFT_1362306 [Armillaria luteobubalina]|uniref:Uncharacterized protein n=1 Tax=Armillaria luteobubalina TaxID=153913 RepID=A0AA39TE34_9AGAR|nr:hypothetical protein EDD18DRAFT_1362306 [Armillaria luteobubalina]
MDNLRSLSLLSFDLHILRHDPVFMLRDIEFGNTRLSEQAEAEILTWLSDQINNISVRYPFLLFFLQMPLLSPTSTQDTFTQITGTLLPDLTSFQGPSRVIVPLAPSRPLINASMTISKTIYAGFRRTTTRPESLPPSLRHLIFKFKSVGKRTEEKTLRSAIACATVLLFKSLRILFMHKQETAQVKTANEELDDRFPLPKCARKRSTSSTISHSGHSMVLRELAPAARLANACPALQHAVFTNGVQWRRPSTSLPASPPLQIHTVSTF